MKTAEFPTSEGLRTGCAGAGKGNLQHPLRAVTKSGVLQLWQREIPQRCHFPRALSRVLGAAGKLVRRSHSRASLPLGRDSCRTCLHQILFHFLTANLRSSKVARNHPGGRGGGWQGKGIRIGEAVNGGCVGLDVFAVKSRFPPRHTWLRAGCKDFILLTGRAALR